MKIHLYQNDLPDTLDLGKEIAVDSETLGLNPWRDRLCLLQLSGGDGEAHLVQFTHPQATPFASPNLRSLLADSGRLKIFHFARFDFAVIRRFLGVTSTPLFCTKIASKLARTYSPFHGLSELCRELLGVSLAKEQQSSDWGRADLSKDQLRYAANDVIYLHGLKNRLQGMLEREGRWDLAEAAFSWLPRRVELDLRGYADCDVFSH